MLCSFLVLLSALVFSSATFASPVEGVFTLKPEVDPASLRRTGRVDVNLGESPEAFVTALWRQFTGETPTAEWVRANAARLGTAGSRRRIDLALQIAAEAKVTPTWVYSDPWAAQPSLSGAPEKKVKRDVGAVFMYFFTSPKAPNGGPGWANNHVPGMFEPAAQLRFSPPPSTDEAAAAALAAYYHPRNPGFWYQEFKEARYAGMDFLLLNTYGPDLDAPNAAALSAALARLKTEDGAGVIKLALFDDTWVWTTPYFGPFWQTRPNCETPERAAILLYEAKWRPFFQMVPRDSWYLVQGRPLVYFYNNDRLIKREVFASDVLPRIKALFKADFGVEPFVALDSAYDSGPAARAQADVGFKWYSLDMENQRSTSKWHDVELTHAMVRWDHVSREAGNKEAVATVFDSLHKDDRLLIKLLNETADTDLLVLATWNDLGEGTGINRAYDYYWAGRWRSPDHFMQLIRRSQAGEKLAP